MADIPYVVVIPDPPSSEWFDGGISEVRGPFSSKYDAELWRNARAENGAVIMLEVPDA